MGQVDENEVAERAALIDQIERAQLIEQIQAGQSAPEPEPVQTPQEDRGGLTRAIDAGTTALKGGQDFKGAIGRGLLFDAVDAPANLANLATQGWEALTGYDTSDYKMDVPTQTSPAWAGAKQLMAGERQIPKGQNEAFDAFITES